MPPPLNLLQSALPVIIMKNSVHTPQKTQHISVSKTDRLNLFREITTDYCDTHAKYINTLCGHTAEHFNGKENGKYEYHCVVNG